MDSLQGNFLLATPQMPDPRFQEQIIYICSHSPEGAMGLVVNHPITDITMADVLRSINLAVPAQPLPPVYLGGPVEMEAAFILYSSEFACRSFLRITDSINISRDPEILQAISKGAGPQDYIFLLGYVGWAAGQLENELAVNGWLTLPADYDDIFHTPAEFKWRQVASKHGIDIVLFGDVIGRA
ncbi:MAG: hypothetical protein A2511_11140 [Deltaproteobacteria bacterium RIFOXYD12_FULL_50_9]|nr:MAG: hypothetical protein A2511_11140 [Deltaproteobacteria bacterium RIFOXYD12_FULL_50_9]